MLDCYCYRIFTAPKVANTLGRFTRSASSAENSPETQEELLLRRKIFFAMYVMTKITLALTLNDPHDEGARWSSGIDAAIGARGRSSRPVYYLTVQRPWTSR